MPDALHLIDKLIAETSGPLELINELVERGVPANTAERIIREAIELGVRAAPYRQETIGIIADLQVERSRMPRGRAA